MEDRPEEKDQLNSQSPNQNVKEPEKGIEYSNFICPPNLEWAQRHGDGNKVLQALNGAETAEFVKENTCPCCSKVNSKRRIPICSPYSAFAHLGIGLPLFFQFVFFCLLCALVLGLVYSVYALKRNIAGSRCGWVAGGPPATEVCGNYWIMVPSAGNYDFSQPDLLERGLYLAALLALFALRVFYAVRARSTARSLANHSPSVSQYSVQVAGLSRSTTAQDIAAFFESLSLSVNGASETPKVVKVNFAFDIIEMGGLVKQRGEKSKQVTTELRRPQKDEKKLGRLQSEVKKIDAKLEQLQSEYNNAKKRSDKFTGTAFVTFDKKHHPKLIRKMFELKGSSGLFLSIFGRCLCNCITKRFGPLSKINGSVVKISKAPEPGAIIWDNIGVPPKKQKVVKAGGILASALSLGVTFGTLVLMKYIQQTSVNIQLPTAKTVASLFISIVVAIFNAFVSLVSKLVNNAQKPENTTDKSLALAWRTSIVRGIG